MNHKAFYKMTYGLYIVTSKDRHHTSGCVVNTLNQVTSSPAQVSVTINKENETAKVMSMTKKFNAVILSQAIDPKIIQEFGFQTSSHIDKYAGKKQSKDTLGIPYLTEGVVARVTCEVVKQIDLGTHIMYIGSVVESEIISESEVLTYSYYRQTLKGQTPPKAPSYQEETKKVGYRCSVCGYVYEGEELPEDYVCPICGAKRSAFQKL